MSLTTPKMKINPTVVYFVDGMRRSRSMCSSRHSFACDRSIAKIPSDINDALDSWNLICWRPIWFDAQTQNICSWLRTKRRYLNEWNVPSEVYLSIGIDADKSRKNHNRRRVSIRHNLFNFQLKLMQLDTLRCIFWWLQRREIDIRIGMACHKPFFPRASHSRKYG